VRSTLYTCLTTALALATPECLCSNVSLRRPICWLYKSAPDSDDVDGAVARADVGAGVDLDLEVGVGGCRVTAEGSMGWTLDTLAVGDGELVDNGSRVRTTGWIVA
jgi:hypothetical protein